MAENPYQSPAPETANDVTTPPTSPSGLRKGVGLTIVAVWNIPIIVVFYLHFTAAIVERTLNFLLASWAAMIPVFVLLVAYSPLLQRLIFTPAVDVASKRAGAWVLAGLWAVHCGIWLCFVLLGG